MRLIAARFALVFAAVVLWRGGTAPAVAAPASSDPPKSVLILSEGPVLPYGAVLRANLIAELRKGPEPINIYEELIDRIRFDSDEYDRELVELYKTKYSDPPPDLVITITEPALDFAWRHRAEIFPASPLLFGAVDERAVGPRMLGANVTGVFNHYDARATVEAALALHPAVRQVLIIGGTSRLDREYVDVASEDLKGLSAPVSITYAVGEALGEVLTTVASLPADAMVVFLSMQRDGAGVMRTGPEVLASLRSVAKVPIYGMSGSFLGHGIVGGMLFDVTTHGGDLAERALKILNGTAAGKLVPMRSENTLSFDARELARFGVNESKVPATALVINREVGLWEGHKQTIVVTSALVLGQSLLIGGLLIQRGRRRKAEQQLQDRQEELHRSQSRYSLATAAGSVGVWDWNFETGELYVDPVLKSILGFDDAEISSRPDDWGSRVHPQDLAAAGEAVKACVDGVSDTYAVEHRMLHKDGSVKWMLSRGSAMRSANGTLIRLVGTKVDITGRKVSEDVIQESQAILDASNREIQDLAGRLISSQEGERARLARDLHDDISQQIAGLAIALSNLKRRLTVHDNPIELGGEIAAIQRRTVGLADNIRRLSHDLHPSVLQHAGLVATLTAHCEEISRQKPIVVTFEAAGDFESTDPEGALCLYRVAQESLRNVVTHAKASRADVRLCRIGDDAELTIADDGCGFDVKVARQRGHGLGLVSITERVRLVGGTISIVTESMKGTRVRVRIPAKVPVPTLPSV